MKKIVILSYILLSLVGCVSRSYNRYQISLALHLPSESFDASGIESSFKQPSQVTEEFVLSLLGEDDREIFRIVRDFETAHDFVPVFFDYRDGRLIYHSNKYGRESSGRTGPAEYGLLIDWNQRTIRIQHHEGWGSNLGVRQLSQDLLQHLKHRFGPDSVEKIEEEVATRRSLLANK